MIYLLCLGGISSETMKEDNALYGSPGADLVSMGDQVLQEDGGNMGGASSWDQFSSGRCMGGWGMGQLVHVSPLNTHTYIVCYTGVCDWRICEWRPGRLVGVYSTSTFGISTIVVCIYMCTLFGTADCYCANIVENIFSFSSMLHPSTQSQAGWLRSSRMVCRPRRKQLVRFLPHRPHPWLHPPHQGVPHSLKFPPTCLERQTDQVLSQSHTLWRPRSQNPWKVWDCLALCICYANCGLMLLRPLRILISVQ